MVQRVQPRNGLPDTHDRPGRDLQRHRAAKLWLISPQDFNENPITTWHSLPLVCQQTFSVLRRSMSRSIRGLDRADPRRSPTHRT